MPLPLENWRHTAWLQTRVFSFQWLVDAANKLEQFLTLLLDRCLLAQLEPLFLAISHNFPFRRRPKKCWQPVAWLPQAFPGR
jgi:hypothetical protein